MASREVVLKMLELFSVVFDLVLTEALIETWEFAMGDLDDEVVMAATVHFVKTWGSQYNRKPRPGDVYEFYSEVYDTSWVDAWKEVQFLCGACAQYGSSVTFSDRYVADACAAVGGLRAIYECNPNALPAIRAQFRDAYKKVLEKAKAEKTLLQAKRPAVISAREGSIQYQPGLQPPEIKQVILEPEDGDWRAYARAKRNQNPVIDIEKLKALADAGKVGKND